MKLQPLTPERFELILIPAKDGSNCVGMVEALLDAKKLAGPVLWSFEHLRVMLSLGRMQLWFAVKKDERGPCLFMLTEINVFPAGRVCHICLIGGRHFKPIAKQFFPAFIGWCREQRVDFIETTTHPKVAHVLRWLGFHSTGVRMHFSLAPFN